MLIGHRDEIGGSKESVVDGDGVGEVFLGVTRGVPAVDVSLTLLSKSSFGPLLWPEDFGEVVEILVSPETSAGPRVIIEKGLKCGGHVKDGSNESESCIVTSHRENGLGNPLHEFLPPVGVHYEFVILKVIADDERGAFLTPENPAEVGFRAKGHDAELSAFDSANEFGLHVPNHLGREGREHFGVVEKGVLD
jgi:hypothetical protein